MARQRGHEGVDLLDRQRRGGRVVGVADEDHPRRGGHLACHGREVVAGVGVERDRDGPRAARGRQVRIHRERRPRVDELGARLEQRLTGRKQDVARPVADRDARGRRLEALREALPQQRAVRVRVAVEVLELALDRLDHRGMRRPGGLVRGELDQLPAVLVRLRGRILGDPAHPFGELQAHCAPSIIAPPPDRA